MPATNLKLEYLSTKYLQVSSKENTAKLMQEISSMLVEDTEVIIDGTVMKDGRIDPAHIENEIDQRFYFHIYSSRVTFDKCGGKKAYVLTFKSLMDSIFQNDTFGGITLNYEKGKPVLLVSKEEIYDSLVEYLKSQTAHH